MAGIFGQGSFLWKLPVTSGSQLLTSDCPPAISQARKHLHELLSRPSALWAFRAKPTAGPTSPVKGFLQLWASSRESILSRRNWVLCAPRILYTEDTLLLNLIIHFQYKQLRLLTWETWKKKHTVLTTGFPLHNTISFLNFFHFLYKITLLWQSRGPPSRQHCLQDQNSWHSAEQQRQE